MLTAYLASVPPKSLRLLCGRRSIRVAKLLAALTSGNLVYKLTRYPRKFLQQRPLHEMATTTTPNGINYAKLFGFKSVAAAVVFAVYYVPFLAWFIIQAFKRPNYVYFALTLFCGSELTRSISSHSLLISAQFVLLATRSELTLPLRHQQART